MAAVLFCSRARVYRTLRACREGTLGVLDDEQGQLTPPVRTRVLLPTLRRSLVALRTATPRAYSWCRTRWSCATLAATLQAKRSITVSAETMRRWVHEVGWVWKRALGDAQEMCTRTHKRTRLRVRVADVTAPLQGNGPCGTSSLSSPMRPPSPPRSGK